MSKFYSIDEIAKLNDSSIKSNERLDFVNYLDTGSLTKNKVEYFQYIENNFPSRAKRKIRENTILYSTVRPNQEHYGIIETIDIEKNIIVSTGFTTIDVTSEEIHPKYLYYRLTLKEITNYLQTIAENSVSAYPSIKPSDLAGLNFRFPKRLIQERIASILSALDAKIELNNRINAELEAMAKTLYDYWFVQFDFPNVEGKPYKSSGGRMVYNETLKREIPEGWEDSTLSDIANITMGQSPNGDSYNEEKDGIIFYQGCTDFGTRFPSVRQYTTAPTRFAKKGDILLSVRAPVGAINIANNDCCIGRGLSALNSKNNTITYLYEVLVNLKQIFALRNTDGTTFGSITKNDLYSLQVIKPCQKVLQAYHTMINPIFKQQNIIGEENQHLTSLRDWLLPMLMNGQVGFKEERETKQAALNIPENRKGFAKQVLGGKIVSLFKDDSNFTHIKFQKLQFLAEHVAEAELNLNYYFQAAGPHDGAFMKTIASHLRRNKWYDEQNYKFIPLEKEEKIEGYYQSYFGSASNKLDYLFSLLKDATENEAEIIATLYAVWNNRIILNQPIADSLLIQDFYSWSNRKQQYSEAEVQAGLKWLRDYQMEPKGFGKEIKRAKT